MKTEDQSEKDSLDQSSWAMSLAEEETPGSALGPEMPAQQTRRLRCFSSEESLSTRDWRESLSVTSQGPILWARWVLAGFGNLEETGRRTRVMRGEDGARRTE